ncbi:MAG: type II toxin-antitoxin system HicB family antitoxin [Acidobacteriota bacterium]|nr:type II toxin-antitoxin system HicB family antitoxin [Acidobacteriota bacterium]
MAVFGPRFPALPGCYSQGETVDELKQNIREALAGVLDVLKEQGRERGLKAITGSELCRLSEISVSETRFFRTARTLRFPCSTAMNRKGLASASNTTR